MNPGLFALLFKHLPHKAPADELPEWKRKSRNNKPIKRPAPKDPNTAHPKAIYSPKIITRPGMAKGKLPAVRSTLSNRNRVIVYRAILEASKE